MINEAVNLANRLTYKNQSLLCNHKIIQIWNFSIRLNTDSLDSMKAVMSYLSPHVKVTTKRCASWNLQLFSSLTADSKVIPSCTQTITIVNSNFSTKHTGVYWNSCEYHFIANLNSGSLLIAEPSLKIISLLPLSGKYSKSLHSSIEMDLISTVRLLARRHYEAEGALLLHGAAAVENNCGVMICGEKGGGKSTLQLAMLTKNKSVYVSGDRTYVKKQKNDLYMTGFPDTVRFSKQSFMLMGNIFIPTGGTVLTNGKISYSPVSFLKQLKLSSKPENILHGLVICCYQKNKKVHFRIVEAGGISQYLKNNNFTTRDPTYVDWLASIISLVNLPDSSELLAQLNLLPCLILEGDYKVDNAVLEVNQFLTMVKNT